MKRHMTSDDSSTSKKAKTDDFLEEIQNNRLETAESILDFKFNKKRVKILNKCEEVPESNSEGGICYWMARDQRVQDNWAMLFTQKLAFKNKLPLHVIFCLTDNFLGATLRHYKFMLDGLEEVSNDLKKLRINFHLLTGEHSKEIPKFVKDFKIGALVCDFSPLRIHREWVDKIKLELPSNVPFIQVDAHNVVPMWEASDKQEYAARTIRGKINGKLGYFLTEFPPVARHSYEPEDCFRPERVNWEKVLETLKVDRSVESVDWIKPGYRNGIDMLKSFIFKKLKQFGDNRNDPTCDVLSNLSPYFHYGQIAVQRAVIEVEKHRDSALDSVEIFCEDGIVRRGLSDNFCFYNPNYDNLKGIPDWAMKTLNDHRKDKREYVYTPKELEEARTHDDIWNSAQMQMTKEGKMHGFLRMYWAKKILEWTATPEEGLEAAMYLNDRYSLDGRDPNGYVGCMWCIGAVHDQPWGERKIFGKIRFMNYEGCKRKFDIKAFIARYGGVVHHKK